MLHANKNLLALEEKWASVHLQTSWKLESCYKPVDTNLQASEPDIAVHIPSPSHSNTLMFDSNVSTTAGSTNNVNKSAMTSTTGEQAVNFAAHARRGLIMFRPVNVKGCHINAHGHVMRSQRARVCVIQSPIATEFG